MNKVRKRSSKYNKSIGGMKYTIVLGTICLVSVTAVFGMGDKSPGELKEIQDQNSAQIEKLETRRAEARETLKGADDSRVETATNLVKAQAGTVGKQGTDLAKAGLNEAKALEKHYANEEKLADAVEATDPHGNLANQLDATKQALAKTQALRETLEKENRSIDLRLNELQQREAARINEERQRKQQEQEQQQQREREREAIGHDIQDRAERATDRDVRDIERDTHEFNERHGMDDLGHTKS
jgi:hypothetical protein